MVMQLPEGFLEFLLNGKRNTYADDSGKKGAVLESSVQLEFSDSNFLYRDIYLGRHTSSPVLKMDSVVKEETVKQAIFRSSCF